MIAAGHLTRVADANGVDAKTVERDYVLTRVLAGIYLQDGAERMAFKGGTALRLCFFDDYRYSADLDFSLTDAMTKDQALIVVAAALRAVTDELGFSHLALNEDGSLIEYVGPLDQPAVHIRVYTLEEIAAEKLRCVIQRVQARDLFDLHQLFVERGLDTALVWPDFEDKSRHKNIDPARFTDMFHRRMTAWQTRWDGEMEIHVPVELRPHFDAVKREVTRALRSHMH